VDWKRLFSAIIWILGVVGAVAGLFGGLYGLCELSLRVHPFGPLFVIGGLLFCATVALVYKALE
jgi:hypothetical protein